MKKDYYNKLEFTNAMDLIKINPNESLIRLEKYIKKYPFDYAAYAYYADNLTRLGYFDDAEKFLDKTIKLAEADEQFKRQNSKHTMFFKFYLYARLNLLSYQGKYKDFYELYNKYFNETGAIHVKNTLLLCEIKLGLKNINSINRDTCGYLRKQMIDYKEDDFFDHVRNHLSEVDNCDLKSSMFAVSFDFKKVLEEIKKQIPNTRKIYPSFCSDVYYFKYNNCGRSDNKITDYFKVICIHDTSNIITMCPTIEGEFLPYIDLNYLQKKEEDSYKIRRKSQIDKFNERFKTNL